jgi:rhodanese-related sulfurtransferase
MRTLLFVWLLGASVTMVGCSKAHDAGAEQAPARVATVSVDELATMLATNDCQAVDANGETTRQRMGIIPGAVLLTSMDSLDGLPADKSKNLVFYCANTSCGASDYAAQKAMTAGYTHVKVLPAGIAGWVKAGQKTSSI